MPSTNPWVDTSGGSRASEGAPTLRIGRRAWRADDINNGHEPSLSAAVAGPLRDFGDSVNIPALSALPLGLSGAMAPCQLTTNAGALAFVARRAGERRAVTVGALAYVAGKVAVYTVVGAAVIVAGREIVPVEGIVLVRRLLGPLMLALGLFLLGVLPFRFSIGGALADRIEQRARSGALS